MIAGLAFLVALGNLARLAEIEVTGPVRDLVVSLGSSGEARLRGELLPGERVRIAVPLPALDASATLAPEILWSGGDSPDAESEGRGRARFLGWKKDLASAQIDELPPGLLARSRPPLSPPEILLPRASLAILPACLVIGLALRRRAGAALAFALVGAGVLLGLGWPRAGRAERVVTVLESDAGSPSGLRVTATWEKASVATPDLESSRVETSKDGARVVWTGSLSGPDSWTAFARGSAIYVERPFAAGERVLDLAEAWIREDGSWTARGPWPLGSPLPPAREGPGPPGWLVAGLPQGVPVLIGRVTTPARSGQAVWVRETGF